MSAIFKLVATLLYGIAVLTGLTYNEINIIVYYIIIPFTWIFLLDRIFKFHYLKIGFGFVLIVFFIFVRDFSRFSDWLFFKSVDFLNFFGDYVIASVLICVFLIIFIYIVLIYLAYFYKKKISDSENA